MVEVKMNQESFNSKNFIEKNKKKVKNQIKYLRKQKNGSKTQNLFKKSKES